MQQRKDKGATKTCNQSAPEDVITERRWYVILELSSVPYFCFFLAIIPVLPLSHQWSCLVPNFQIERSYQWCLIPVIYVTGQLCFSCYFLLPHPLEEEKKEGYLVASYKESESRLRLCDNSSYSFLRAKGEWLFRITDSRYLFKLTNLIHASTPRLLVVKMRDERML